MGFDSRKLIHAKCLKILNFQYRDVSWIICQCWRMLEVWIKVEVGVQDWVTVSGRDVREVRIGLWEEVKIFHRDIENNI